MHIEDTKQRRSTRESTVQRKQPPTIFSNRKHIKGISQDTHTQTNRGQRARHDADVTH